MKNSEIPHKLRVSKGRLRMKDGSSVVKYLSSKTFLDQQDVVILPRIEVQKIMRELEFLRACPIAS